MRQSATTLESEISPREMETLLGLLRKSQFSGRHLEIGTAAGGTLKEMMLCYPAGRRPRFVVIDPMTYFPGQLEKVKSNLSSAGVDASEVEFRIGKSWPAFHAAEKAGETYSFMFIDGSHKLAHVTEDLAWTRLLDTGGIVCLHDYEPKFPGVTMATDRFISQHPNYEIAAHVERLIALKKTAPSAKKEISAWDLQRAKLLSAYQQIQRGIGKRLSPRG